MAKCPSHGMSSVFVSDGATLTALHREAGFDGIENQRDLRRSHNAPDGTPWPRCYIMADAQV